MVRVSFGNAFFNITSFIGYVKPCRHWFSHFDLLLKMMVKVVQIGRHLVLSRGDLCGRCLIYHPYQGQGMSLFKKGISVVYRLNNLGLHSTPTLYSSLFNSEGLNV